MFWEDYYLKNPTESKTTKDGNVVFQTGDPLIDKWEQELQLGVTPDLLEGVSSTFRDKFNKKKEASEKVQEKLEQQMSELGDGFDERYT